ncbi:MAG: CpsD/CapB family tyrosine-protein kinase [Terriglobales bacterium]
MSNIFEALQRAEAERTGGTAPVPAESVADLLQEIEQVEQTAAEARAARTPERPPERIVERAMELAAQTSERSPDRTFDRAPVRTGERSSEGISGYISEHAPPAPQLISVPAAETEKAEGARIESFAEAPLMKANLAYDSRLICMTDQGSVAAEQFRVLGLKLRQLREKRKLKRVVVTGTAPQEGKSLVAANLALNQARSKVLKTVLLDGDLRRPALAERFGLERSLPGLSECLTGERRLLDSVYKIADSGLWFLPAGRPPDNPLELMQAGRLQEVLNQLGSFFDWIIIDTPPVLPVADTSFWMTHADGVLMVIREGVTEKRTVEKAIRSFEKTSLLGVVVNSCTSTEHKDYYSRYSQAGAEASRKAGK